MNIKFKGQRLDKSETVDGDLIHGVGSKAGRVYILPNKINLAYVKDCDPLDGVEVIPESVSIVTTLAEILKASPEVREEVRVAMQEMFNGGYDRGFWNSEMDGNSSKPDFAALWKDYINSILNNQ